MYKFKIKIIFSLVIFINIFLNIFFVPVYAQENRSIGKEYANIEFNLSTFGIKRDEHFDISPLLNKIMDTISEYTTLHFPPGKYLLSGIVHIRNNNIIVSGDNAVILLSGFNKNVQPYTGFYSKRNKYVTIKGLTFIGENKMNESAIWFENCSYVLISECSFKNIGLAAIMLSNELPAVSGGGCKFSKILNNTFYNNYIEGSNLGVAVFLFSDANKNYIVNNYIKGRGWVGIAIDDATIKSGPPYLPSKNNIVMNNYIAEMSGSGILIEGSINNRVARNVVEKSRIGILLNNVQHYNPADTNIVTENYLFGNSANGITIIGSSYNLITGNYCIKNESHGIRLQATSSYSDTMIGSNYNTISNNMIFENNGYGIYINDDLSANNSITDNFVKDNIGGKIYKIFVK